VVPLPIARRANYPIRCALRVPRRSTRHLVLPTGLEKYQKRDIVNVTTFIPRIAPNVNTPPPGGWHLLFYLNFDME
jgi:hypothetical protein